MLALWKCQAPRQPAASVVGAHLLHRPVPQTRPAEDAGVVVAASLTNVKVPKQAPVVDYREDYHAVVPWGQQRTTEET